LLIERDPALADVWTHRHRSEADKNACRKAFTFSQGINHLKGIALKSTISPSSPMKRDRLRRASEFEGRRWPPRSTRTVRTV
jgi:hypothetical protein